MPFVLANRHQIRQHLARVAEITGGDSLASNIRLVYNNAKLAAQTAVAFCKL